MGLLGVTFTEAEQPRKSSKKSKKSKKEKKEKKEKKSSKHRDDSSRSGSDDDGAPGGNSSGSDREGAGGDAPAEPAVQREAWMTQPMERPHAAKEAEEEQAAKEEAERKKIVEEPEVVVGLRVMKPGGGNPAPAAAAAPSGRPATVVGDGGLSWRLKALKRSQEAAAAEGKDVAAVVGERWGSLQNLTSALTEGRAANARAHLHAARDRERAANPDGGGGAGGSRPGGGGGGGGGYLQGADGERVRMKRPELDQSLRWRRGGGGATSSGGPGGAGSSGSGRDSPAVAGGRAAAGRDSPAVMSGLGPGRAAAAPGREDRRDGGREDQRDGERDRGDGERDRRDGDGGGRRGREEAGREERGREGGGRRGERDDRGGGREGGRRADGRGGGRGGGGGMGAEQAAALQGVAGAMNQAVNDGGFMERFLRVQEEKKEWERERSGGEKRGGEGEGKAAAGGGKNDARRRGGDERRQREREAADAMREEMKRLRHGMGGGEGGDGDGEDGEGGGADGEAPGRGGMELSSGEGSDGDRPVSPGRPSGGGDATRGRGRGPPPPGRGREEAPDQAPREGEEEEAAPAGPSANKSVAEMLRARLKGLPAPAPSAAPVQPMRPAVGSAGGGGGGEGSRVRAPYGASGGRDGAGTAAGGDRGGRRGGGEGSDGGEAEHEGRPEGGRRKEVVILPQVDAAGRVAKGAFGREAAGTGAPPDDGRGKRHLSKRVQRYDEGGQKARYFKDDDNVDLDTMVKRAKYGDDAMDGNLDRTVTGNIMRKARFKANEMDVDDEYEHDGGLELYESRGKRGTAEQQAAKERQRQVAAYNRAAKAEQQCQLCPTNPKRPVHLTIASGTCAYLSLPARGRLVPGHCCIVPKEHTPSIRLVDDNTWTEVKNFIKCLIQMFGAQGKEVIFWETATQLSGHKRHAVLEAVPVGGKEFDKAPGFFKKAMQEAESEWSTHAAKSVIETSAKKGLRESVPPNFPYVYVQFGYGHGMLHVIDDEAQFDVQLARQVLVGLLKLPPEMMHARHQMETPATQQQWAREFVAQFAPYDWTMQL